MQKTTLLISLIVIIGFTACEKKENEVLPEGILGVWVQHSYEGDVITYVKTEGFDDDKPGVFFGTGQKFTKRANSGWCGTPPISYTNYDGNYTKLSEDEYAIDVAHWGGREKSKIKIHSVSNNKLKLSFVYSKE